jgi:hypothetical protein
MGRKTRLVQPESKPPVSTVDSRKIDSRVYEAALRQAGGDKYRLDWKNAKVRDGVIVEIRVLNTPKKKG